ncbi:MAG TPA: penicillin-binding transpeptidase domain-containing protein [Thermoanaerobaculia bacterium]|nr:penicillin-binding transpeptidase domain-containing protein [Thermoanaerobaculia bacterium]
MIVPHKRLLQVFAVLAAWALIVVARLVQVQLVRHDDYTNRALKQQERTLELSPVRGQILDARMRVLAESVAAGSIYADPQAIPNHRAAAVKLAPILHVPARDIESRLDSDAGFVWIARHVPVEVVGRVKHLGINGISFIDDHRRAYPRGSLAANVIGYVGVDGEGLAGVEHSFDAQVRGRAGRVTVLRDARRGMYLVGGEGVNRPVDGNDVVLTIDSVVQFITERALAKAVDKYHAAGGSAIVMDARAGGILAMASLPTFDPNHFRDYPAATWRNRNVQEIYEPGSTFKIITASAAIEEGVVTPSQILDCANGAIQVADVEIHDHGGHNYGLMTFEDVMVHSSNVGTVRVALNLGERRLYDYVRRFGFGQRTNIQLPGEAAGLLRRLRHWSDVSVASIAIGQEIGVTPLQLVRAIATVANGGTRVEPRIIDRVVDNSGATIYTPERPAGKRVVSERTAAVLNEILKSVVYRGTGERAALPEHVVAGKSGTAQKAVRGGYAIDKFIASFGGYVPADRPRLVILVVVDEPKHEQYGGVIAAPAFREIAEGALHYLRVTPSVPQRTIGIDAPALAAFSQPQNPAPRAGVPDLKGLDARAAVARATAAGLIVDAIGSGVVTTQNPGAGEALPDDRHVSIMLAESAR